MSGHATNNLSKERIQHLLTVIGSQSEEEADPKEAIEYNWREPACFSRRQLVELEDFTKRLATAAAERFSGFCSSQFDVAITSIAFYFAGEFLKQKSESESENYNLPFAKDHEPPCGCIGIPEQTAVVWARQLLGDSESERVANVTLSQLEESLLQDLASALVEAFSALHKDIDVHPAGTLLRNQWPLKVRDTDALCKIAFDVKKKDSEESSSAYLLILCEELNAVVGRTNQASHTFSPEEISKTVLKHLQGVPVVMTAQLVSTELTFEEVATLQVNDVLVLDKKVHEPVDLMINGRPVYCGWLAKSAGKYAVKIASAASEEAS